MLSLLHGRFIHCHVQIEFRDVTFTYPARPEQQVLKGVSFVIPAGKTAAFVGSSGSGLLLRLVC